MAIYAYSLGSTLGSLAGVDNSITQKMVHKIAQAIQRNDSDSAVDQFKRGFNKTYLGLK